MGFGTILWGLGAMIIALLYIIYPGDAKVNAWWIVLFYAVLMFAEGFTCPIGYSITAVAAPKAFVTQMMTVWSMSQSVGAALNMISLTSIKKEAKCRLHRNRCSCSYPWCSRTRFQQEACRRNGNGKRSVGSFSRINLINVFLKKK